MTRPTPRLHRWQTEQPNFYALGLAVFMAAVVGLSAVLGDAPDSGPWRMAFAAALMLLSFDPLVQATAQRAREDSDAADRVTYGMLMGLYFGSLMFLFIWEGDTQSTGFGAMIGGLIFGAFMGLKPPQPAPPALPPDRYDTSRPLTATRWWRVTYRLWPFVGIWFFSASIMRAPDREPQPSILVFQMFLMPWIMPLYGYVGSAPWHRGMTALRMVALSLLLAGYVLL